MGRAYPESYKNKYLCKNGLKSTFSACPCPYFYIFAIFARVCPEIEKKELFVQERLENRILCLSVYSLCFARAQADNRWPPDQLWLACMRGLLTVSRRGEPSPVYYPLIFPALGHATAALTSLAPVSACSFAESIPENDVQTLIYVRLC